uniref:Uncharacterized protein n=1 Tax=Ditylenchus dipsaci TaxID=166011 RepID=A0A915DNZ1_9BILA
MAKYELLKSEKNKEMLKDSDGHLYWKKIWLLGREQKDENYNWDLHTIFPELPSQLYVDKAGSSKSCSFNHCHKEEVTFEQPVVNSSLRAKAQLKCKFSADGSQIETKRLPSPFVWPLRENLIDDGDGSGNESRKYSVRRSDGLASLEIDHLTSDELGYVACKCFECRVPRFAIAEKHSYFSAEIATISDATILYFMSSDYKKAFRHQYRALFSKVN